MKVLITGGAGFIGSHIVDKLALQGVDLAIVDNLSTGNKQHVPAGSKLYVHNLSFENLDATFSDFRPDYVLHLAAQVSVYKSMLNPIHDADSNIMGTLALLECCKKYTVKKIVYSSSAAVYGNPHYLPISENHPKSPLSPYGLSKYIPENYIKLYSNECDLKYSILRYSNVFGPRQDPYGEGGVVSIFTEKILTNQFVSIFGDGSQTRDFIYVKDIAEANLMALINPTSQVVNISSATQTSLLELFETMKTITNYKLTPKFFEPRPGDIQHSVLNNAKAKEIIDWEPKFTLLDGLQETFSYYS